jgi:exopolysaccharide biosynthesis polyprenyl glycosylphosphotransferase
MRAIDRMVNTAVMSPRAPSVPLPGPAFNGAEDMIAAVRNGSAEVFAPPPVTRPPIPAARLVATLDVLIVLSLFVALIIGINLDYMPDGLDAFLALRFTVKNAIVVGGFVAAIAFACHLVGLYNALRVRRWRDEVKRVLMATIAITVIAAVAPLAGQSNASVDRLSLLLFSVVTFAALTTFHALRARLTYDTQRRRAIIIGTGPRALRIYRALSADVLTPYRVLGFVDAPRESGHVANSFIERRTLGRLEDLETLLGREHVDEVYIGLPVKSQYGQIEETIRTCEHLGVKALYPADIVDTTLAKPRALTTANSGPHVQLQMAPEGMLVHIKRVIDFVGASAALLVLSPIIVAAAIGIKATSTGPVIYAQERYGLNRGRFRMFKFRTMVQNAERLQASLESQNEASGPVFKIANDPRITPIGRFLRRSSIDELPQLFNVLSGDMSLVGPRPLPLRDVDRFTRSGDLRRFSVRPGVTCLWQVSGRSGVGFDEWVALDLQYIDRWSLFLDLVILLRTVPAVLRGTGAR